MRSWSTGVNVGSNYIGNTAAIHSVEPRTAFGLSQDRHYLFLLTIDGRQSGYSEGAYDWETAAWLLLAGAWDGANLDGGGSTCLAIMDSTGRAVQVNRDCASLAGSRERTVGCQFGIFAKPVPGFFTNVLALPDDTAATITWTTLSPATTELQYGLTTNCTLTTGTNLALTTNHAVLLTNLTAATEYYFTLVATIGTNRYVSSNLFFLTTNYVTTNALLDWTKTWKYTAANLDGVTWTSRGYDDSAWNGPAPGLLWADSRGANTEIPASLNTEMPLDDSTGYPFTTYYFRTHFTLANASSGINLRFDGYVDDGAVFYLNGTEIYRLRMPASPTAIENSTLALTYPCAGDATCVDSFTLSGSLITTNLVNGDNVLAVEVHNYNAYSADVTFGLSATATLPYTLNPELDLARNNSAITLSWSRGGFTLQEANAPTGTWANVAGPVFSSPLYHQHLRNHPLLPPPKGIDSMNPALAALLTAAALATPLQAADSPPLTIKGSDTLVGLSQKWADAYRTKHPAAALQIGGGGAAAAFAALADNSLDLAVVSRSIRYPEAEACQTALGQRPAEYKVAVNGLAVYVHTNNPIKALTYDELAGIFKGRLTRWKDVGGPDAAIAVYAHETNTLCGELFNDEVLNGKGTAGTLHLLSGPDPLKAIAADPAAIGYGPLTQRDGVRCLGVKRAFSSTPVEPTEDTIANRIYPISRFVFCYARPDTNRPAIQAYADWLRTDEGQQVVREAGCYALPAKWRPTP